MSKERLSKLQRWILSESYKINILHDSNVVGRKKFHFYKSSMADYKSHIGEDLMYQYFECWIYENYYGFRSSYGSGISRTPAYKRAHVTVTRTIKNMEQKGLIYVNQYLSYNMKNWRIMAKGIEVLKKSYSEKSDAKKVEGKST